MNTAARKPKIGQADKRAQNDGLSKPSFFRRHRWTSFRSLDTLAQCAGVPRDAIGALVVKELTDNASDAAGTCDFGLDDDGWIFVEDAGPGLAGTDAEIADVFSVSRQLSTSKLLRMPTCGRLGNGLCVVTGAVLATGGELIVKTRGRALRLRPRDADGGTDVERIGPWNGDGTRVEVMLGPALPIDGDTFTWANRALDFANVAEATSYRGKTSPWWYDSDSFFELLQAAGVRTVRDLVADFAGCAGAKTGRVARELPDRACNTLTRRETELLLAIMRRDAPPVPSKRLGRVGREFQPDGGYALVSGTFQATPARGTLSADIPFVVEAWAEGAESPDIEVNVNRTPITAEVGMTRGMQDKSLYGLFGCGLSNEHENTAMGIKAGRGREFSVIVNIIAPHMPITTDGKAPDLSKISGALKGAIEKAIRCAKRRLPDKKRKNNALPRRKRGRQSAEDVAAYEAKVEQFAQRIRQIRSRLDFRPSSRGYCYVLENERVITKGDFDACQKLINDCRKAGILPLDICCEDSRRQFECVENINDETPEEFAKLHIDQLWQVPALYLPFSFWDDQEYYIQMLVEKIDLVQLFLPICKRFHIPIANTGGWADVNSRAIMMQRFAAWEAKGKRCVLLYCGDLDPGGSLISGRLRSNMAELQRAADWDPTNVIIDRFGLNQDFIEEHDLTWIDGLITASGRDLADPRHPDHKKPYVQDWLREIGPRKVEANALVVAPDAGRELCLRAITQYVAPDAPEQFISRLDLSRQKVRRAIEKALRTKEGHRP